MVNCKPSKLINDQEKSKLPNSSFQKINPTEINASLVDPLHSPRGSSKNPQGEISQLKGMQKFVEQKPCPPTLDPDADLPKGWKPYYGASWVFHCGFRGMLEDREPTKDEPMNECFYDKDGNLVDKNHKWSACGGSPDQYDSKTQKWDHFWKDTGGLLKAGGPAFFASISHWFMEDNEIAEETKGMDSKQKEAFNKNLTLKQKAHRIKTMVDCTICFHSRAEGERVIELFKSSNPIERKQLYQLVEGHDWNGNFRNGYLEKNDDIWKSLNQRQINRLRKIINEK